MKRNLGDVVENYHFRRLWGCQSKKETLVPKQLTMVLLSLGHNIHIFSFQGRPAGRGPHCVSVRIGSSNRKERCSPCVNSLLVAMKLWIDYECAFSHAASRIRVNQMGTVMKLCGSLFCICDIRKLCPPKPA